MYWSAMYSMFAVASGVCGFGGIAGPTAWLAQILSVLFGVLALVCTVDHVLSKRAVATPPDPGAPPDPPLDDVLPLHGHHPGRGRL